MRSNDGSRRGCERFMTIRRPTVDDLSEINRNLRLGLTRAEIEEFVDLVDETLGIHDWLEQIDANGSASPYAARTAYRPSEAGQPTRRLVLPDVN